MRYDFVMKLFGLSLDKTWLRQRYGRRFYLGMAVELVGMWLLGALRLSGPTLSVTPRGEYYWIIMMREFFNNVNVFRDEMRHQIRSEYDSMEHDAGINAGDKPESG